MQKILDDTSLLYKLNNIEINSSKSDLLHLKSKLSNSSLHSFTYNNQTIIPRKPTDTIRYLGIFYDGNGSSKPTLEKIHSKIENFFMLIRYKKITSSQISAFFNLIL
jgi:hypothetical protein